eukprot:RCo012779
MSRYMLFFLQVLSTTSMYAFSLMGTPSYIGVSSLWLGLVSPPMAIFPLFSAAFCVAHSVSFFFRFFLSTAPELMVGQPYSFGVDLWALGCILYEMAALHPPFVASNFMALVLQITNGKYDPLPTQYSPALSGVVNSLLVQDPHDR